MSKLIECKDCESKVSSSARACPSCGRKMKSGLIHLFIFVALLCLIVFFLKQATAQPDKRAFYYVSIGASFILLFINKIFSKIRLGN